ncbi:putative oxidoreductase [Pleomassaria siparia CBS 279.74]|uniref:Putative oxidoreductase n=1 Tax=Pleomassaria siparia CBS 279.74 TaxID=1314801 RepID=A0A6G1KJL3_9PLEO|nr:putative oxidoreductase [Pleomassaria siparia CBS 279.74]
MSPQQPLRTAFIGLSSSGWASIAHLPALRSALGGEKFSIMALLNSSVPAAGASIGHHNLPASTRAYGSPEDLAADPDIDLVICNTRVDKHFETILPSVKAGKNVYVEWPIASNTTDIDTLVAAARKSGSRVAVGLQNRWAPQVFKLEELLHGGKLGKVLSSDLRVIGGTDDREILVTKGKYFAQREIGGNVIVINFGHVLDFVLHVLGDLAPGSVQSKGQIQRPSVRVRDTSTNSIVETVTSDVPDLLSLHGTLTPSKIIQEDATLSAFFRRGQAFPGDPPLAWSINCEFGEIRLLSTVGTALFSESNGERVTIHVHHFDTDTVEEIPWEWEKEQEHVPTHAKSVLRCLASFADAISEGKGSEGGDGWVGLEDAARRARQIEKILSDGERKAQ